MRHYASVVYAVIVCLPVCPSVTSWHCIKRPTVGSRKQRCMIAQGLWFYDPKDLDEIPMGSPLTGAPNRDGVG